MLFSGFFRTGTSLQTGGLIYIKFDCVRTAKLKIASSVCYSLIAETAFILKVYYEFNNPVPGREGLLDVKASNPSKVETCLKPDICPPHPPFWKKK